ncbi:uncharacterized protein PHALS_14798 [Plasmopara halstedii]|uniref:Uncharacterized protein n=1 Tax=Plasmopara halstedii TaxID=4781 RepID=A0A0N7L6U8_PLAHL|nr:uncharacterized protein PHALS_14798 [Plasmopara halstedii]CEG45275.1 hypothetical protein PHALS_14798 [Plasmopara halstedii]|eukprot:XP_024581644.1 hypothetical protein PHALS_14798 [Plasmopara halstedii]
MIREVSLQDLMSGHGAEIMKILSLLLHPVRLSALIVSMFEVCKILLDHIKVSHTKFLQGKQM